jgi:hypothetical protein
MLYSDCRFFGDTPSTGMSYMQLYPPRSSEVTFENMLLEEVPMIFPSCVVARRSALVEVGLFDESLTYSEDRELALRVAHRGLPIAFLKRPLVMRRAHAGSLNATRQKVEEGELNALEKLGRKLDLSPAQRLILERRIGRLYASIDLREGKQLLAEGKYEEAKQSLARANAIFHRRKLNLLLSGLRFAPRLTRWAARAWLAMDSSLEMGRRRLKFGRP